MRSTFPGKERIFPKPPFEKKYEKNPSLPFAHRSFKTAQAPTNRSIKAQKISLSERCAAYEEKQIDLWVKEVTQDPSYRHQMYLFTYNSILKMSDKAKLLTTLSVWQTSVRKFLKLLEELLSEPSSNEKQLKMIQVEMKAYLAKAVKLE